MAPPGIPNTTSTSSSSRERTRACAPVKVGGPGRLPGGRGLANFSELLISFIRFAVRFLCCLVVCLFWAKKVARVQDARGERTVEVTTVRYVSTTAPSARSVTAFGLIIRCCGTRQGCLTVSPIVNFSRILGMPACRVVYDSMASWEVLTMVASCSNNRSMSLTDRGLNNR